MDTRLPFDVIWLETMRLGEDKEGVCSRLDVIFSWRDFNFQHWFFIPWSILWMLRRNVEEIVRACKHSIFPV